MGGFTTQLINTTTAKFYLVNFDYQDIYDICRRQIENDHEISTIKY